MGVRNVGINILISNNFIYVPTPSISDNLPIACSASILAIRAKRDIFFHQARKKIKLVGLNLPILNVAK